MDDLAGYDSINQLAIPCSLAIGLFIIPKQKTRPTAKPLSAIAAQAKDRKMAIIACYKTGAYSQREIGECYQLHPTVVAVILYKSKSSWLWTPCSPIWTTNSTANCDIAFINMFGNKKKKSPKEIPDDTKPLLIGTREGLFHDLFPTIDDQPSQKEFPYNTDTKKMMLEEYSSLRKYLEELRNCQITFFWSSITVTGVILTIAAKFYVNGQPSSSPLLVNDSKALFFSCLAAILIVCPVWSIWFLKASSITRVAGYLRVLEDIISGKNRDKYKYIGWENSYFVSVVSGNLTKMIV